MKKLLLATLAAALISMTGCGSNDNGNQDNQANAPDRALTPNPDISKIKPPSTPTAGRVPSALSQTESSAEDLVDFARAKKRAKVVAEGKELRRLAQGRAAAALKKAKVPSELISVLQSQATSTVQIAASAGFLQVALAANQVSGLMPQLYGYFSDPVPPAVLKLDYLDREAQFRSIAKDRFLTRRAVDQLSSTWKELRAQVVKAGGDREAARYDRHVAKMRRLAESFAKAAIRKEAANGLQLVDELEGVFRR
jgi:hypothetical protein